ncbi:MAG: hypothetical protein DHS20C05_21790 [Hyphococcus sp.]|nr:MAG: hypothetical protein DHS20C05_21790 [Marinicaulis sp.]
MSDETKTQDLAFEGVAEGAAPGKVLPEAAKRALKEAEERRKAAAHPQAPKEIGGPRGEEPTRYGDWERGGRAVDF